MRMGILLSIALSAVLVTSAAAAPTMVMKGHKSLSFEADTDSPVILFGWNVADMTKLNIGAGLAGVKPGVPEGVESETQTSWAFQGGISRYLGGISNNIFTPMIGASIQMNGNPDFTFTEGATTYNATQGTGYEFRGYFGVEAFVIDNLSIGGNVGVGYVKEGEVEYQDAGDPTAPAITVDGDTEYATSSSAIQATIYW